MHSRQSPHRPGAVSARAAETRPSVLSGVGDVAEPSAARKGDRVLVKKGDHEPPLRSQLMQGSAELVSFE